MSTRDPGSAESQPVAGNRALPQAPGALPLLPTFPAPGPEEGAFPVGSRAILKAARLGRRSSFGARGSTVEAALTRQREPVEGYGTAAGLLSTGGLAASGTVSASKGRTPFASPWGPWGSGWPGLGPLYASQRQTLQHIPRLSHSPFFQHPRLPQLLFPSSLAALVL